MPRNIRFLSQLLDNANKAGDFLNAHFVADYLVAALAAEEF